MCGRVVDIQSAIAENRRGKKKRQKKPQGKNIMSASATQGGHKKEKVKKSKRWGRERITEGKRGCPRPTLTDSSFAKFDGGVDGMKVKHGI